jgi:colanic acid/amylovoran biosynthesis glycosyltransferase
MLTIAYLANQFPSAVEPYVSDEIQELRRQGVNIVAGSVRRPDASRRLASKVHPKSAILCLKPLRMLALLRALLFFATQWRTMSSLLVRILLHGKEGPGRRMRALLHTLLGAYYAVLLQESAVDHIHVHHGYFGSWIAMVAARLLGISFSLTLHGSDLLLHPAYLDTKLHHCRSCVTISDYNRRYILDHFPEVAPQKVVVSRLGVDVPLPPKVRQRAAPSPQNSFALLTVGRLHAVKDHAFLIRACARLRDAGLAFRCSIAGEGPERHRITTLIWRYRLEGHVTLLGHMAQESMEVLYRDAQVVVLTSISEGIPLVLMEAMVRGKIVVAPDITGVPELVIPGKTGFLYRPGDLEDFVHKIRLLEFLMHFDDQRSRSRLNWIRHAARVQVLHNFNRESNVNRFGDALLRAINPTSRHLSI